MPSKLFGNYEFEVVNWQQDVEFAFGKESSPFCASSAESKSQDYFRSKNHASFRNLIRHEAM